MFEITSEDIALLDDEQLRAVVARLCEEELRQRGLSPFYVKSGGHQNAPDGGIDVRVELPSNYTSNYLVDGFIPRPSTGFQVKRQDMPTSRILKEMRPGNILRPSIQALADCAGAYIIVSSQGSTAGPELKNRLDAMSEAMKGEPNAHQLELQFCDRSSIATWVSSHERIVLWILKLIGRKTHGWHPYESWANPTEASDAEYLIDDKLRIHASGQSRPTGVSAAEGIAQLRGLLREPRTVVRLVGLSGVGKTRLVQALFDPRIGDCWLDPASAFYTDTANAPDPPPTAIASDLVARGTRAILVIDNCSPDLHRRLSAVCRQPKSMVSVITVEYDIREDEPEGTEVFRIETSSIELIEKLLRHRFPELSQVNAHSISIFSDGNARIAIALAGNIEKNETVAGLTDEWLLRRLIVQRHLEDDSLYRAAQVCSLVYSFQGEDLSAGDDAEMIRLSNLSDLGLQELNRHVVTLHRRDLVQRRGMWRAVLPHALANRLAAIALQFIPYQAIEEQLLKSPSCRLIMSFSRRLGYLHESKEADRIVAQWLSPDGLLSDLANFNDFDRSMFKYVAPVSPEATLSLLERTWKAQPLAGEQYLDLIRSIAYESAYFERCLELLVKILALEKNEERSRARHVFGSLFQLHLSGTRATIEQRLKVIASLLGASEGKRRILGVLGLQSVLEASHFEAVGEFSFGAQLRDYGYWPSSVKEVQHWFSAAFKLVEVHGCGDTPVTEQIRTTFAEKFQALWNTDAVEKELLQLCRRLSEYRFWPEGWRAVRQALDGGAKDSAPDRFAQLVSLENDLRPTDLPQQVRSIVLAPQFRAIDLDEFQVHTGDELGVRLERAWETARLLGTAVAADDTVLEDLLPELVSVEGRLEIFGRGLSDGTAEPQQLWNQLVAALAATDETLRKPQVLRGFLHGVHAREPVLASTFLNRSVDDPTLAQWFPFLQIAVPIDEEGVARLRRSLALGNTPVWMFQPKFGG